MTETTTTHTWRHVSDGWAMAQGGRDYQEDRIERVQEGAYRAWAVYDGHGGEAVAEHLQRNAFAAKLVRAVFLDDSSAEPQEPVRRVIAKIREFFTEWDERYYAPQHSTGACVCVAILHERSSSLWLAWSGDSRAVVFDTRARVLFETRDHKPSDASENNRIIRAGASVLGGRVLGVLATSRAMGDADLKRCKHTNAFSSTDGAVTALPDVAHIRVGSDPIYLCVATDGVWDAFSSSEQAAVELRNTLVTVHANEKNAARSVLKTLERRRRTGEGGHAPNMLDDNKSLWLVRIGA